MRSKFPLREKSLAWKIPLTRKPYFFRSCGNSFTRAYFAFSQKTRLGSSCEKDLIWQGITIKIFIAADNVYKKIFTSFFFCPSDHCQEKRNGNRVSRQNLALERSLIFVRSSLTQQSTSFVKRAFKQRAAFPPKMISHAEIILPPDRE